jgi:tetratricopeptide (TPR) repeat protein
MGSIERGEIRLNSPVRYGLHPERTNRSRWELEVGSWKLIVALVIACAEIVSAQHYEHALPADFNEPIRLYTTGLGTFTRPISSSSAEAQAYFNQGFQLMYGFAKVEAGRSFREAQTRDPECAICYWGEAWAWGPYVNGRMTVAHAERAHAAIQKAVALADRHANATEQALIRAMSARYGPGSSDRAYADAMARVAAAYPDDLDVATLYAEALFLLLPRPRAFPVDDPTVSRVLTVLEGALKRDVRHPGACHLYIHMTELTPEPERAVACAEHLGNSIPGASHINHMPAHVWTRVGRWGDAVRASLQAWQSDQKAAKGEGFLTYPAHDLHMLAFAASMDGQSSVALQAARGFTRLTDDSTLQALVLVRFGRFQDVESLGPRPSSEIPAGMWDFAHGYAALRRGETDAARTFLNRLRNAAVTTKSTFRIHPGGPLLQVVAEILDGEIALTEGRSAEGITAFYRALVVQGELALDDPEPFPFAVRHWLGAALIQAKRFTEAERVYREDLARHPHNGWALIGLQQALRGQGKPTREVDDDLRASWARADVRITGSRF